MAKQLTQIHIHTQYAHRRPKKVYRRLSGIEALMSNPDGFTHQASIVYGRVDLRVYLDAEGEWHGYPFASDPDVQVKEVKQR